MKMLFVLTLSLCAALVSSAQNKPFAVDTDGDINQAIAPAQRFQYPAFTTGQVFFKDGKEAIAPLNYNRILGEMQFIDGKGDTLSLTNEAMLNFITLNNDTFFYDKLYLQRIDGNANLTLAKNETLKLGDIKKIGAYGTKTSGADITTYSSVVANSARYGLKANQEIMVEPHTTYYIGDVYHHFLQVNKKNLTKMFSKNQTAIENYLNDNKPNWTKEGDMRKLMEFLKTADLK